MKEFLPIGSIVTLKDAQKKLMVIGRVQVCEDTIYKYSGVLYPEGFMGADNLYLFNESDIINIDFKGFSDNEEEQFSAALIKYVEANAEVSQENKSV